LKGSKDVSATLETAESKTTGRHRESALRRARIVCVDDEPNVVTSLRRMLRARVESCDVQVFSDSRCAWNHLCDSDSDLVITDVSMPGISGIELVRLLRDHERTCDVPIVVLTGRQDSDLKRKVLDLGATDLLSKPIQPDDLLARVRSALRLKHCQDALKRQNEQLEHTVIARTRQLQSSRGEIIWRLAKAAEFRDQQTGNHVLRVAHYSRWIAEALNMSRQSVETLFLSAPLHDLGKIGIPDSILHKPGRLTDEERQIVETHCEIGERILGEPRHPQHARLLSRGACPDGFFFADQDSVLAMARDIAASHHERWDGTGYPRGLAGDDIPLAARIVAIADVYDALTSARPYKHAFDPEAALEVICLGAGRHFDPEVHEAFMRSRGRIENIRLRLSDGSQSTEGQSAWIEFPEFSGGEANCP
jgi:putative two-component system response regulator